MAARVASVSGGLRLLRTISQTHEIRSAPGRRLPAIQRVSNSKYLILCYHRVGTEGIPSQYVDAAFFHAGKFFQR